MEYQSLYRRYRPQKFAEVKGQHHVIRALQNAVRDNRVGHAYLLSGPRGTGKTTLARILAKVLNCEQPSDGEPCGQCPSCKSIEAGTSFDLHELDAASNNKVDDMRDLLSKVALGTPGRTKVYLLDEVHMLSSGAENALLKTLEEPPDHVVFVLATTEPHKVVSTIRSRTQHLELTLVAADEMAAHVRWIAGDAGLNVTDDMIDYVIRVGGGSVRDTLSALDQVIAAGGVAHDDSTVNELLTALAGHDAARAIATVAEATRIGRDPRVIGESLIEALRSVFLVAMGDAAAQLTESERARAQHFSTQLSPGALTHALEIIGTALVDMRQAPDPRIDLEVALVKLTRVASDTSLDALVDRIERLERRLERGVAPTDAPASVAAPPKPPPPAPPPAPPSAPARSAAPAAPTPAAAPEPLAAPPAAEPPTAPVGTRRPADEARQQLGSNRRPSANNARSAPSSATSRPAPSAPTRSAPRDRSRLPMLLLRPSHRHQPRPRLTEILPRSGRRRCCPRCRPKQGPSSWACRLRPTVTASRSRSAPTPIVRAVIRSAPTSSRPSPRARAGRSPFAWSTIGTATATSTTTSTSISPNSKTPRRRERSSTS